MTFRGHPTDLVETVASEVERLSGGAPVAASVRHGVVTLTGAVANEMRRISIEQAVSNLPGVKDVRDKIHVAQP
jgi:osmotically-inducible protein OsmY